MRPKDGERIGVTRSCQRVECGRDRHLPIITCFHSAGHPDIVRGMKHSRLLALVTLMLVAVAAPAWAADITGKWTASFDTQIGVQNYTYEFTVKDGKLTGHAKSENGDPAIQDGKVDGDTVTFVENLSIQGMDIRIVYTGKIVSADEIKFTRTSRISPPKSSSRSARSRLSDDDDGGAPEGGAPCVRIQHCNLTAVLTRLEGGE